MESIQSILKDFYKLTGASLSVMDADYRCIAGCPGNLLPFCICLRQNREFQSLCHSSDRRAFRVVAKTKKPYIYRCHCGLYEIVAPIFHFGEISGYIMIGQFTDCDPKSQAEIAAAAAQYTTLSSQELQKLVQGVPRISADLLQSYTRILTIVAEHLTMNNAVRPARSALAERVAGYLAQHYRERITIADLCSTYHYSRVTVMESFKKTYHTTVMHYLQEYRLTVAAELLQQGELTVKQVAAQCGFSDQNYFSRVFKARYGCSPLGRFDSRRSKKAGKNGEK